MQSQPEAVRSSALVTRKHPQFETLFRAAEQEWFRKSSELVGASWMERFIDLSPTDREELLSKLDPIDFQRILYAWALWARPKQLPPTGRHYRFLVWLCGRHFGKSRTAAEWTRWRIENGARSIALVGPTLTDIMKCQIHGESGLMAVFPPNQQPRHWPDKRLITWKAFPDVECHVVTAEEPEYRGGNVDTVWADELAKWKYRERLWDNIDLSARSDVSGLEVQIAVTTTPLPIALLKELVLDPDCWVMIGDSSENVANRDAGTSTRWERKFRGTRLGQQELGGRILGDNPDALFKKTRLEDDRVEEAPETIARIVAAVDSGRSVKDGTDQTAIVVEGIDANGDDLYVLFSRGDHWSPKEWSDLLIDVYFRFGCDAIVVETNSGGDLVKAVVRGAFREAKKTVPKIIEVHARHGKECRAEPVSAISDRKQLHFVGVQTECENEITEWVPGSGMRSPNLLDALVWGAWELAKLGEEDEPDNKEQFEHLAAANREMRAEASAEKAPVVARDDDAPSYPRRDDSEGYI